MTVINSFTPNEKATMYCKGGIGGVIKKEIRLNDAIIGKYAQYESALKVYYKEKRAKKLRGTAFGYRPYCVIVRGWNQPDLKPVMEVTSDDGDAVVKESRHTLFSENYHHEADEVIDNKINKDDIIVDDRYTK